MSINPPIQPTQQQKVPPDLRVLFDALGMEFGKQINCVRPGIIQSFDPATCTASIQISQQQVTSIQPDGTQTLAPFAPLENVPVEFQGGGGATATFPIAAGDECLLLFNDREIDNWYLTGQVSAPTSPRLHDFSDAFAIVGIRSAPRRLGNISTTEAQLRSDDGETSIGLNPTAQTVTITAPSQVILNSPLVTIIGNMNLEGTGGADTATIDCNLVQTSGKTLSAGNGVTGSGTHVTAVNGIVTAIS